MTVNELLGLSADANQAAITDRVVQLVQNEKDLLEVTGKDTVAAALGVVIAQKDAATELEKARALIADYDAKAQADEAASLRRQIDAVVASCIHDGRVSIKDTERQAQLVRHGEKFGLESLKETVAMLTPRPVRQFQVPVPQNSTKAQMKAIEDYKAANPGTSTMDAYTALAAKNPALFADINGEEA